MSFHIIPNITADARVYPNSFILFISSALFILVSFYKVVGT